MTDEPQGLDDECPRCYELVTELDGYMQALAKAQAKLSAIRTLSLSWIDDYANTDWSRGGWFDGEAAELSVFREAAREIIGIIDGDDDA